MVGAVKSHWEFKATEYLGPSARHKKLFGVIRRIIWSGQRECVGVEKEECSSHPRSRPGTE